MTENKTVVMSVQFDESAMVLTYMEVPDDVRVDGNVAIQKSVRLGMGHPDYLEDCDRLHDMAVQVLRNALEDFDNSTPFIPSSDDDDDEKGMGFS